MAMTMEQFIHDVLGLTEGRVRDTGWFDCCCPLHGEKNPSFGIRITFPYYAKCYVCGSFSMPYFVSRLLKTSMERATELIREKVALDFSNVYSLTTKMVEPIPPVVAEMYKEAFNDSIAEKYANYRCVPKWLAKLWEFGYDELQRGFIVPMRNVKRGNIQGYMVRQFNGDFSDITKLKNCDAAAETVTLPINYKKFQHAIVCEGVFDATNLCRFLWRRKEFLDFCPVVLNTAFPSREQFMFIRKFDKVVVATDHDDTGERAKEFIIKKLADKAKVFTLNYPATIKDPGEIDDGTSLSISLALRKNWAAKGEKK